MAQASACMRLHMDEEKKDEIIMSKFLPQVIKTEPADM